MSAQHTRLVIEGVNEAGRQFRPSDWSERLSAMLAVFGRDHRLIYADSVQPCMINGVKCVMVEKSLATENPSIYNQILSFARMNGLRTHEE